MALVSRALRWSAFSVLLSLGALLSACGGGGGGSGGAASPPPSNPPNSGNEPPKTQLLVDQVAFSLERAVNEPAGSVLLNVSIVDPPAQTIYLVYGYTDNGIDHVSVQWIAEGHAAASIAFRAPLDLPIGKYEDVLVMQLCEDADCATAIEDTEVEVPIEYTVTVPAEGNEPAVLFESLTFAERGIIEGLSGIPEGPNTLFVPMQFQNFGGLTPRVKMTHSENALLYGDVSWIEGASGATFSVRSPPELGVGNFHDTITISVCLDVECQYPAKGSPYTVTFDYTISNSETVPGEMGYTWTAVDFDPAAFVWDAAFQRILATRNVDNGGPSSEEGRLAAIDPEQASVDWEISLGARTERLALSADGQFAYVVVVGAATAQIQKIHLTDRTLAATLELPDPAMSVAHLQVAPGTQDTLAVIAVQENTYSLLRYVGSSTPSDRYDFAGEWITGTFGSDAGTFYAYDPNSDELYTFSPSADQLGDPQIQAVDLNGTHAAWSILRYQSGLLFESHGAVFDPAASELVASLALRTEFTQGDLGPDSCVVAPGADIGRAFYWYRDTGAVVLHAFDLQTELPLAHLVTSSRMTFELIRWGDDGLAFVASAATNRLVLLRGNFVRPAQ